VHASRFRRIRLRSRARRERRERIAARLDRARSADLCRRREEREEKRKRKKVKERKNTAATRRDRFSRYYSARANSGVKRAFRQIRKIKPSSFAATAGRKCREPRHIFIKYISRRNQPCTLAAFEGGCRVKFCARARRTGGSADFAISGSMKSLKIVCTAGLARCPRA